ncbi:MAG: succinate--CoA ligase subunit beta [Candidatus Lokiarchaeota archaeon]|nr:succinate--CoA ligase subunit beta [Candidatus Lokiarchaeota archaeon]
MVRLYEYESKKIFKENGIKIPNGQLINDLKNAENIKFPVMLKAQVLTGGRGKIGGVVKIENDTSLRENYERIKNSKFKGYEVKSILLEETIEINEEFFLSITIDNYVEKPLLIFSKRGGVDIEELFENNPEEILKIYLEYAPPLNLDQLRSKLMYLKFPELILNELLEIINNCYQVMFKIDANLVEINPLGLTSKGLIALDAHIGIDHNSIFRQSQFEHRIREELKPDEYEAESRGMAYVDLENPRGVGVICNGAGLVMGTMDAINDIGGVPANFLDIGGGADQERIYHALKIISKKPFISVIFINIFGGITRCDEIAKGIIRFLNETKANIIIRMIGTNFEDGQKILLNHKITSFESLPEALNHLKKFL